MLVVTNRRLVKGDFIERLREIDSANIDAIVLREKDLTRGEIESILDRANLHHKVYINNPNMQKEPYISISFHDLPCNGVSETIVSVHSVDEARIAEDGGADILITGHIFATDCKRGLEPRGLDYLREVVSNVHIPVYAIGGISLENVRSVMETGTHGVAVMSSAMQEPDVKKYLDSIYEIECKYR